MSAHFESAISRLRPTSERRARTTAVATLVAAQNGTSGEPVPSVHVRSGSYAARKRSGPGDRGMRTTSGV